MKLTPRMKNWIEQLGVHVAVATKKSFPTVIVSTSCKVNRDAILIPINDKQKDQITDILSENKNVAIAPGQIGAVRAPYQFKGNGKIEGNELVVEVKQIYCTRPGAEAGIRMDILGFEDMKIYDESRWKDINPPVK
ncbi:MAG: hypothetical protein ACOWWR_02035 [Eubacteriales bacterium]